MCISINKYMYMYKRNDDSFVSEFRCALHMRTLNRRRAHDNATAAAAATAQGVAC